jgi:hypothetical protein
MSYLEEPSDDSVIGNNKWRDKGSDESGSLSSSYSSS